MKKKNVLFDLNKRTYTYWAEDKTKKKQRPMTYKKLKKLWEHISSHIDEKCECCGMTGKEGA